MGHTLAAGHTSWIALPKFSWSLAVGRETLTGHRCSPLVVSPPQVAELGVSPSDIGPPQVTDPSVVMLVVVGMHSIAGP